tara:strand:+ start:156 stop:893 length:738 start_codon:yes stop_codon:yes gene_type:complete
MTKLELKNQLKNLIQEFNFLSSKKYKLIIFTGLLGDFDSIEYAINLSKLIKNKNPDDLDIFFLAIGTQKGKEKFCKFTGFPESNLKIVESNHVHNLLGVSKGIDIGLGGWVNMTLMLMGIGSPKTIYEVLRGYTGDKKSSQIYSKDDLIDIFNLFTLSGELFEKSFGIGYLRPFELATFRLNNMIEILKNWNDYIINAKYLPQRSCSFILDKKDEVIYKYFSKDILNYSSQMSSPLAFLSDYLKE